MRRPWVLGWCFAGWLLFFVPPVLVEVWLRHASRYDVTTPTIFVRLMTTSLVLAAGATIVWGVALGRLRLWGFVFGSAVSGAFSVTFLEDIGARIEPVGGEGDGGGLVLMISLAAIGALLGTGSLLALLYDWVRTLRTTR